MKAIVLLILLPAFSYSQTSKETKDQQEKSKIETFSLKTGSLIKKDFATLGNVKEVEVQTLKLSDVLLGASISGIKLNTIIAKSYGNSDKSCFLDTDEVDALLKCGKYLLGALKTADNYVEYQFTSRAGFQAGAYQDKTDWKYFIKLEKYDSDSYVFLERAEFEKLIELISNAKAKM